MVTGMLYKGYSALTTLCTPVAAGALLCSRRGRQRYAERFGGWGSVGDVNWWFHGASVGEVQGILPVVGRIRAQTPTEKTLLTSTSPTGLERGAGNVDHLRLLPLDAGWCVRRALKRVNLGRFVLCETELWPVVLSELHARGIPLHVINGRVSDYTLHWYRKVQALVRPMMRSFRSVSVANADQRDRYIELGARPESVFVTGHSKYDVAPRHLKPEARQALRRGFFPNDKATPVIITLGSIRPGEEEWWFDALTSLKERGLAAKMIVAPRHAERFSYFAGRIASLGLPFARWSEVNSWNGVDHDILLLDTMGKLEDAYAVADLAFVGATLVDIGGHNPLEPAMYAAPVVVGPYTSVVRDVVDDMRSLGGVLEVRDAVGILRVVERAAQRDPLMRQIGEKGQMVWEQHRGAAERITAVLRYE